MIEIYTGLSWNWRTKICGACVYIIIDKQTTKKEFIFIDKPAPSALAYLLGEIFNELPEGHLIRYNTRSKIEISDILRRTRRFNTFQERGPKYIPHDENHIKLAEALKKYEHIVIRQIPRTDPTLVKVEARATNLRRYQEQRLNEASASHGT